MIWNRLPAAFILTSGLCCVKSLAPIEYTMTISRSATHVYPIKIIPSTDPDPVHLHGTIHPRPPRQERIPSEPSSLQSPPLHRGASLPRPETRMSSIHQLHSYLYPSRSLPEREESQPPMRSCVRQIPLIQEFQLTQQHLSAHSFENFPPLHTKISTRVP